MRKLLKAGGRSAICAAALTLSPLSPNFNSAEASNNTHNCPEEIGRTALDAEVCVEEPIPEELGHNVMEDYRVWLIGGAVLTAVGIGLGVGLNSFSKRMGYLESDGTPESIEANLIRHQNDEIARQKAWNDGWDKVEKWWEARGETPVSRYLLSTTGRGVEAVWKGFKTARKEAKAERREARAERALTWSEFKAAREKAKVDKREERLSRTKSGINRKGGILGENTRS